MQRPMRSIIEPQYKRFGRRWLVLLVAFVVNGAMYAVSTPFVLNASVAADYFAVPVSSMYYLPCAGAIVAAIGAYPGIWIIERAGARRALAGSALAMMLGTGLRLGALRGSADPTHSPPSAYLWVFLGTLVQSLGHVPIQASTSLLSAAWFDDQQRGLANTLMCLSVPTGLHLDSFLHSLLGMNDVNNMANAIAIFLPAHCALAILAFLASLMLQPFPRVPPCVSAETAFNPYALGGSGNPGAAHGVSMSLEGLQGAAFTGPLFRRNAGLRVERKGALRDLSRLIRLPSFIMLLAAFSCTLGAFRTYYIILEEFLDEGGVDVRELLGSIGAVAFTAGFIGFMLDRTRAYKVIMGVSQTIVLVFAVALTFQFTPNGNKQGEQACLVCMGIMGFLILPTALEMAVEIAYPLSAALSTGLLWMGSQIVFAVLAFVISQSLAQPGTSHPLYTRGGYVIIGAFGFATLMWWCFPVRFVREVTEQKFDAVNGRLGLRGGRNQRAKLASRSLYIIDEENHTSNSVMTDAQHSSEDESLSWTGERHDRRGGMPPGLLPPPDGPIVHNPHFPVNGVPNGLANGHLSFPQPQPQPHPPENGVVLPAKDGALADSAGSSTPFTMPLPISVPSKAPHDAHALQQALETPTTEASMWDSSAGTTNGGPGPKPVNMSMQLSSGSSFQATPTANGSLRTDNTEVSGMREVTVQSPKSDLSRAESVPGRSTPTANGVSPRGRFSWWNPLSGADVPRDPGTSFMDSRLSNSTDASFVGTMRPFIKKPTADEDVLRRTSPSTNGEVPAEEFKGAGRHAAPGAPGAGEPSTALPGDADLAGSRTSLTRGMPAESSLISVQMQNHVGFSSTLHSTVDALEPAPAAAAASSPKAADSPRRRPVQPLTQAAAAAGAVVHDIGVSDALSTGRTLPVSRIPRAVPASVMSTNLTDTAMGTMEVHMHEVLVDTQDDTSKLFMEFAQRPNSAEKDVDEGGLPDPRQPVPSFNSASITPQVPLRRNSSGRTSVTAVSGAMSAAVIDASVTNALQATELGDSSQLNSLSASAASPTRADADAAAVNSTGGGSAGTPPNPSVATPNNPTPAGGTTDSIRGDSGSHPIVSLQELLPALLRSSTPSTHHESLHDSVAHITLDDSLNSVRMFIGSNPPVDARQQSSEATGDRTDVSIDLAKALSQGVPNGVTAGIALAADALEDSVDSAHTPVATRTAWLIGHPAPDRSRPQSGDAGAPATRTASDGTGASGARSSDSPPAAAQALRSNSSRGAGGSFSLAPSSLRLTFGVASALGGNETLESIISGAHSTQSGALESAEAQAPAAPTTPAPAAPAARPHRSWWSSIADLSDDEDDMLQQSFQQSTLHQSTR